MFEYFRCPQRLLRFSSRLLVAGVLLLSSGIAAAYGDFVTLGIGELIGAHVLIVLGPTLFKLGYVMRLAAQEILARGNMPTDA